MWSKRAYVGAICGIVFASIASIPDVRAQTTDASVARRWNEVTLDAIRNDFARPTVHARNLFHISLAMYDAWTAYDIVATPFLLGQQLGDFVCPFDGLTGAIESGPARNEAVSFAAYRLIKHRFQTAPGATAIMAAADSLMSDLGYDGSVDSEEYGSGEPSAMGNYVARCVIDFGFSDGSNEIAGYSNSYYSRVNPPLVPTEPGNPDIRDPNRWQPLALDLFIDQAGNPVAGPPPPFLGPEWGNVYPFALRPEHATLYERDGDAYRVYHDAGSPPPLDKEDPEGSEAYRFGFSLVAIWSSHADPNDGVIWDISPGALGNLGELPKSYADYPEFFSLLSGGDPGAGRVVNPITGRSYTPHVVPRGDYVRVLAEYWADGPDSETPPGHWFTILNSVVDHEAFRRRYRGTGPILDPLEWDVKSYLALGGAMHDAAVAAWSHKGWYDYVRPVSAIRYMADRGQSTDSTAASYSPDGLPLVPGYVELVTPGDPLAGAENADVGKIKLLAWRGPEYISNAATDAAGVGWILAENWWPYQRPTFVTPPFAGYVSGHSTFSRAAAVVLTFLTGDPYFPDGLGEFTARKNEFLVFEDGPSVDVILQWATYRDAADQTSLSRIWGGIHPPADDIPGRMIGQTVGTDAARLADVLFSGKPDSSRKSGPLHHLAVFPNPAPIGGTVNIRWASIERPVVIRVTDILGRTIRRIDESHRSYARFSVRGLAAGSYYVRVSGEGYDATGTLVIVR